MLDMLPSFAGLGNVLGFFGLETLIPAIISALNTAAPAIGAVGGLAGGVGSVMAATRGNKSKKPVIPKTENEQLEPGSRQRRKKQSTVNLTGGLSGSPTLGSASLWPA